MNDTTKTPETTETLETFSKERGKVSSIGKKRAKMRAEKRARMINQGLPEDQADAILESQDAKKVSLEEIIRQVVNASSGSIQGLVKDIQALHHNQQQLALAMDVNFRAMSKMLERVGVPLDVQTQLIEYAQRDIEADMAKLSEADEKTRMEGELKRQQQLGQFDANGSPVEEPSFPEGATIYGE